LEIILQEMQDCFERQDVASLQSVAVNMPPEEFQRHLKRCVDSGLWLPDGGAKQDPKVAGEGKETVTNIDRKDSEEKGAGANETEVRQRKK